MTCVKKEPDRILPEKAIIGMIHVPPLPDSPLFFDHFSPGRESDVRALIEKPLKELEIYQKAGVDAVMIENMHDLPYSKPPLPNNTVNAMILIGKALRKKTQQLPIGIQMLEAANCEAMEIACRSDLDFIRVEGFVYAHVGGAGLIEASARDIINLRKKNAKQKIKIFADVKKKHCAHALTADLSVGDITRQSELFCADGIIVTGSFTGEPVDLKDFKEAKRSAPNLPLLIGSGITPENLIDYHDCADGFIVGSYFKKGENWKNDIDPERVKKLVKKRNLLKKT